MIDFLVFYPLELASRIVTAFYRQFKIIQAQREKVEADSKKPTFRGGR